jgi:hypothetical protein
MRAAAQVADRAMQHLVDRLRGAGGSTLAKAPSTIAACCSA